MTLRIPSPAVGLVVALGSAAAGCGSEEMFAPELGINERLIDTEAFGRIARSDEGLEDVVVVGDLDGDGIDDAVIRSAYFVADFPALDLGAAVYVVYGGSGVTGNIDMATLPTLSQIGAYGADVVPVGDVDGDGLADFLVGVAQTRACANPVPNPLGDAVPNSGAYLVYGSRTRLTGTHPIGDAGAFLRDPEQCTPSGIVSGLGDIDGDGQADFAIGGSLYPGKPGNLYVFYGRSTRLSGTLDLTTTAAAVITNAAQPESTPIAARAGDVDGDGVDDFMVMAVSTAGSISDVRLVRGSATRLSGTLASQDLGASQFLVHACSSFPEIDALGDLDGDGVDDFALSSCQGATLEDFAKNFHLFYGRKGGFPAQVGADDQDATLPTSHGDGPAQLIGGDADGDGTLDLILVDVGLHGLNGGVHLLKGKAGVRLSGVVDPIAQSSVTYVGQPQRDSRPCADPSGVAKAALGWAGVAVGDVNGDHHPDLMISALAQLPSTAKGGPCDTTLARVYLVSPPASTNP